MKSNEIKTTHYSFGNKPETREKAESMIFKFHGKTTKQHDGHGKTYYINSVGKHVANTEVDGEGDRTFNVFEPKVIKESLFEHFKRLSEDTGTQYSSGTGYTARVISKNNKHVAKFFKDGVHMKDADYEHKDPQEVHDFAQEEMKVRSKQKNEEVVDERIQEPQGHKETADPISDDSLHGQGKGKVKKMMGNRNPIEIIAKILAKG